MTQIHITQSNGETSQLEEAAQDVARSEAAVIMAQAAYDAARKVLLAAEAELRRAEGYRDTARGYYHELNNPSRQHSAITKG